MPLRSIPLVFLILLSCAGPRTWIPRPSGETRAAAAGWDDGRPWLSQHEDCLRLGREEGVDLVFFGDSITQALGGAGRFVAASATSTWDHAFGQWRVANFGISGDRIENLLWRMEHGTFDGIQPKLVVLLAGTNNLPLNSSSEISSGLFRLVENIRALPSSPHVALCGLPPRGFVTGSPERRKGGAVNAACRNWAQEQEGVHFVDFDSFLLTSSNEVVAEFMADDGIHLSSLGYRAWANALKPIAAACLSEEN